MNKPHDCNSAYQAAVRQLANDSNVTSVVIEFVMKTTGLTKYMKVSKNDNIEVLSREELDAELEAA